MSEAKTVILPLQGGAVLEIISEPGKDTRIRMRAAGDATNPAADSAKTPTTIPLSGVEELLLATKKGESPSLRLPLGKKCGIEVALAEAEPPSLTIPGLDDADRGQIDKKKERVKSRVIEWLNDVPTLPGGVARGWLDKLFKSRTRVVSRSWWKIGREVYARKTLVLAATSDLLKSGLTKDGAKALSLASTDIFVEKAQHRLTVRGFAFYAMGFLTAILTLWSLWWFFGESRASLATLRDDVTLLAVTNTPAAPSSTITQPSQPGIFARLWYVFSPASLPQTTSTNKGSPATNTGPVVLTSVNSTPSLTTIYLTLYILKSTAAAACVFGGIYFLAMLSRAFFHEATTLFNRRHSLRFGRLCVYLSLAEGIKLETLKDIFAWNAESSTAFKDIKADMVAKSPTNKAIDLAIEAVRAAGAAKKGKE